MSVVVFQREGGVSATTSDLRPSAAAPGPVSRLDRWAATPVPVWSLAIFRTLFGLLMTAAMVRLLALGWVDELYVKPSFPIPYAGFEWVRALPGGWMHAHVAALAGCALGIALGFQYRWCATLFLVGFAYIELIDQTTYLNHYYLATLLSALLVCLPAQGAWSVDAWRDPRVRRDTVPAWMVDLLRFQFGVVYFFAGVAKLNGDWLWRAQPLRIWLPAQSDLPLIGACLGQAWVAYGASWLGAVLDLSIPFFLVFRRTRFPASMVLAAFHVGTWLLFPIGLFPWLMLAGVLIFFPPDWPRRWLRRGEGGTDPAPVAASGARTPRWQLGLLGAYVLAQLVIPLREFLYPGPSAWSGEGFDFAWKVMVAEKTGDVTFYAWDPLTQSRRRRIDPRDYVTARQELMMAQDPHLARMLARQMAADLKMRGEVGLEIRVDAFATLNGRPSQRIIDPTVDLAGPLPGDWILPLGP